MIDTSKTYKPKRCALAPQSSDGSRIIRKTNIITLDEVSNKQIAKALLDYYHNPIGEQKELINEKIEKIDKIICHLEEKKEVIQKLVEYTDYWKVEAKSLDPKDHKRFRYDLATLYSDEQDVFDEDCLVNYFKDLTVDGFDVYIYDKLKVKSLLEQSDNLRGHLKKR